MPFVLIALTQHAKRCYAGFSALLPAKVRSIKFTKFRNAMNDGTTQSRMIAAMEFA